MKDCSLLFGIILAYMIYLEFQIDDDLAQLIGRGPKGHRGPKRNSILSPSENPFARVQGKVVQHGMMDQERCSHVPKN